MIDGRTTITVRLRLLPVVMLAGILSLACANVGGIDGQIVDHMTGKPVVGATMTVDGTTVTATTDAAGAYHLSGVVPGTQAVTATKAGFADITHVSVTVGGRTTVAAKPTEMLSYPPYVGVFSYRDGVLSPLGVPAGGGRTEHIITSGPAYVGIQMAFMPKAQIPVVSSPVTLIARTRENEHFFITRVTETTLGGRSFMMNSPVVRYWRIPVAHGLNFDGDSVAGGLTVLTGAVQPGFFVVLEQEANRANFFRARRPGPELKIAPGTYVQGSKEYEQARAFVLVACITPGLHENECGHEQHMLQLPPSLTDDCTPGTVVVPARPSSGSAATFTTAQCEMSSYVHAELIYDDGWRIGRIMGLLPEGD